MLSYSFLTVLNILEQQHTLLFALMDLGFKSTIVLLAIFLLQCLLPNSSPASKSAIWMMAFASLLLLPLFHEVLPTLSLSLNYQAIPEASMTSIAIQVNSIAQSVFGIVLSYLFVCALLTFHLLIGVLKVVLLSHKARPFRNEIACQNLKQLQQMNGFSRSIELLVSSEITSPVTWGILRHKIIFPLAANGWSEELLQQTISHEIGHVQRGDWVVQLLARFSLSLYWINPLAWLAYRELLIETEKACDDVAVENSGSPLSYAQNLLQLAKSYSTSTSLPVSGLLGFQSSLSHRIRHILKQEVNRQSSDTSHILPSLLIAAIVVAPLSVLSIQPRQVAEPKPISEMLAIPVSFFPSGSQEHDFLMSEFRSLVR